MAKTNRQNAKVVKKNKKHLKKSARWTIAGLMLVTALIIALIPVQSDGVSAITSYTVPTDIYNVVTDHGFVEDTSVKGAAGTTEYAFPISGDIYTMNLYDDDNDSFIGNYAYADIDMTTMDNLTNPVVVYQLCRSGSGVAQSDCIEKYLGVPGSGSSPKAPDMKMTLGAKVIVPDDNAIPESVKIYNDRVKPTNESAVVKQYRETPVSGVSPLDSSISFKYIALQERTITYTYHPADPDNGISAAYTDIEEGEWSTPKYVLKSRNPSGQDTISRTIYSIGDDAFKGVSNIKQMEIPTEIVYIGDSAFEGCTNLETVTLSTNCKTIGDRAFANSSKLKNIDISYAAYLSKIGDGAFANTGVESIKFPSGALSEVGSGAFFGCSNLSNVDFSNTADSPGIKLGCYCFAGCPIESISLNNVTDICSHATGNEAKCGIFTKLEDQNSVLKEVTFPSYNKKLPYGTFAGNNNLSYVRFDKPSGTPHDIEESGNQHNDKDEFFYEPDSFFIFGSTPSNSGPEAYKYAVTNGITYGYLNNGALTYELTKNGYKYTFEVINDSECRITKIEESLIVSPESEMNIPAKIAQYQVKEIASQAVDVATLDVPKELLIPDTLQTISDKAFYNMPNLTKVTWYDADNTASGPEITIGNEAFAGNNKITEFNFRDDNHSAEYVNDPNIVSVGTDAFKTLTNSQVTIKGKMGTGYAPFDYAVNLDNRYNSVSSSAYIKYISGNPENLICQYDPDIENSDGTKGAASLLSYPTRNTKISKEDETPDVKIEDLISKVSGGEEISVVDEQIIDCLKNIIVPYGVTSIQNAKSYDSEDLFKNIKDTESITIYDVDTIPDEAFASTKHNSGGSLNDIEPSSLQSVSFIKDVVRFGAIPFANSSNILGVGFYGEGDSSLASSENPYYWCSNGIIYSYKGLDSDGNEIITIEECLPSRGSYGGNTTVDPENDADISRVSNIVEKAFMNCDTIKEVDFSTAENLREISKSCFYDADNLNEVKLPANCDSVLEYAFSVESGNNNAPENYIDVYVPDVEVYINASAFDHNKNATLHSYNDSAAEKYAKDHPNVDFKPLTDRVKATYIDFDGTVLAEFTLDAGDYPDEPSTEPQRTGFTFIGWSPKVGKIYTNTTYVAQYSDDSKTSDSTSTSSSGSSSSSSTGSGSSSGSGTSSSSSSSSSTNKSSSSSSTNKSSSASSTNNRPVVISGAPTPVVQPGSVNSSTSGGAASNSPSGSNVTTGNTNVVSTAPGLSNNGKMSATVNGSSDNYVIKLTETAEADECAKQALSAAFGSLDNIRYMPFDISLYDSTGTQKISPVPEGVTVSVTMPIPDSLQVYGGNNKVASTVGGTLETIKPRFTVIDGVPCMNFTVSHLSPYVIYVDTANLTASGTLDATPKTGDPIHPKWFLCIGLTAISIFLFLKRDKDTLRAA